MCFPMYLDECCFYTSSNIYDPAFTVRAWRAWLLLTRECGEWVEGSWGPARGSRKIQMGKEGPSNLIFPFHLGLPIKIVGTFQKCLILYSARMSLPWISQAMAMCWIRYQSPAHNQVLSVTIAGTLWRINTASAVKDTTHGRQSHSYW